MEEIKNYQAKRNFLTGNERLEIVSEFVHGGGLTTIKEGAAIANGTMSDGSYDTRIGEPHNMESYMNVEH